MPTSRGGGLSPSPNPPPHGWGVAQAPGVAFERSRTVHAYRVNTPLRQVFTRVNTPPRPLRYGTTRKRKCSYSRCVLLKARMNAKRRETHASTQTTSFMHAHKCEHIVRHEINVHTLACVTLRGARNTTRHGTRMHATRRVAATARTENHTNCP